jgi:branched-chain amino acid transport system ATP-binding protein
MVEIARALVAESDLLLLDEPAVGLIPPARMEIMGFITNLAKSRNVGVILIEHSIDMVLSGADLITVLNFGKTIATGTPAEIRSNKEVMDAYLGHW